MPFGSVGSQLSEYGGEADENFDPSVSSVSASLAPTEDVKQRGKADVDSHINSASGLWQFKLGQDPVSLGEAISYRSFLSFTRPVDEMVRCTSILHGRFPR